MWTVTPVIGIAGKMERGTGLSDDRSIAAPDANITDASAVAMGILSTEDGMLSRAFTLISPFLGLI